MNDLRFSTPPAEVEEKKETENSNVKRKFNIRKYFLFALVLIVLLAALFFLPSLFSKAKENFSFWGGGSAEAGSEYYAVFLDNSQVYFGRLVSKSAGEMVISDVYYLQAGGEEVSARLNDQRFTLIKLGQELHGPTSDMMINMQHVVFYENLRADSKVVESIRNKK